MAISYAVFKAAVTMTVMYRATGPVAGIYTYNQRRAFLPFNLLATGLSVGDIDTATLIFTVATTTGGGCLARIKSANNTNGFGATLDASNADWSSTAQHTEGDVLVNATGVYSLAVAPANLDFTGTMYYRIMNSEEGASSTYNQGFTLSSTTAAEPNRPILRLVTFSGQVIFINAN